MSHQCARSPGVFSGHPCSLASFHSCRPCTQTGHTPCKSPGAAQNYKTIRKGVQEEVMRTTQASELASRAFFYESAFTPSPSGWFHGLPRWGNRKVFKCSWGNESQHAQKGTPKGHKMITEKQNLGVELKDALHLEHWKVREESFRLLFTLQWRTLKGNER